MKHFAVQLWYWASAATLALSIFVHGLTYFNINPYSQYRFLDNIVLLSAILFMPIFAVLGYTRIPSGLDVKAIWRKLTQYAPRWIKILFGVVFCYVFFNFFFSLLYHMGWSSPGIIDGQKVLHSHGKITKKLTDEQYQQYELYEARGTSGHPIYFSFAALMVAWSELKRRKQKEPDRQEN